ncbi:hypothetical protein EDD18DRAFT_1097820 [Armillaria luteobubalina]|uniref:Uncharacterized protein n=1 Tax=Armillaria luteobubalina TaxID=153913 RepID=A0AA39QRH8_9AGAR|nr:hypothetical protein EDD18DRAFT_1097820 [Armillaria luteobubalina]
MFQQEGILIRGGMLLLHVRIHFRVEDDASPWLFENDTESYSRQGPQFAYPNYPPLCHEESSKNALSIVVWHVQIKSCSAVEASSPPSSGQPFFPQLMSANTSSVIVFSGQYPGRISVRSGDERRQSGLDVTSMGSRLSSFPDTNNGLFTSIIGVDGFPPLSSPQHQFFFVRHAPESHDVLHPLEISIVTSRLLLKPIPVHREVIGHRTGTAFSRSSMNNAFGADIGAGSKGYGVVDGGRALGQCGYDECAALRVIEMISYTVACRKRDSVSRTVNCREGSWLQSRDGSMGNVFGADIGGGGLACTSHTVIKHNSHDFVYSRHSRSGINLDKEDIQHGSNFTATPTDVFSLDAMIKRRTGDIFIALKGNSKYCPVAISYGGHHSPTSSAAQKQRYSHADRFPPWLRWSMLVKRKNTENGAETR